MLVKFFQKVLCVFQKRKYFYIQLLCWMGAFLPGEEKDFITYIIIITYIEHISNNPIYSIYVFI